MVWIKSVKLSRKPDAQDGILLKVLNSGEKAAQRPLLSKALKSHSSQNPKVVWLNALLYKDRFKHVVKSFDQLGPKFLCFYHPRGKWKEISE